MSKKQRLVKRVGISTAERPRHVWSWDFVAEQAEGWKPFFHVLVCWTNTPRIA
ncbi:MAG TPA: hypothetical protein VIT23_10515 [Terrimicrobiaceae bacterium]